MVAGELGIPYYVANMRDAFDRDVMAPFAAGYASGSTPIPCVACNDRLKFRTLLHRAQAMGAAALATGHYARVDAGPGRRRLLRAIDRERDQSYFLYGITQEALGSVVFPLGGTSKEEVRDRARRAGLPVSDKPDSQEICFVPDGDHARFVASRQDIPPGAIRDGEGRLLGAHPGIHHFTVGQRRGLGVSAPGPLYVTAIDAATHTVVVGPATDLLATFLRAEAVSWVAGAPPGAPCAADVRIRSRHQESPATVVPLPDGAAQVTFAAPQRGIAPGQAAVFYAGDEVLGGGVITRSPRAAPP
jgi:tRNA-specific 2-thiouridylase